MREQMVRKAADNKYLHRDFHNFMNLGIVYIAEKYGEEAVREYLRQFARSFYAPLTAKIREQGLGALKEHLDEIYRIEEASADIVTELKDDGLTVRVKKCPAVAHMKKCGITPSPLYVETSRTVNETICEGTPFAYRMESYEPDTGASVEYFYRRGGAQKS